MTEESKKKVEARTVNVPTQTIEAIEIDEGDLLTQNQMLVLIYNKLLALEQKI